MRAQKRPAILAFMLAVLVLAACSAAQLGGNNWPGISAENDTVYLAYGPAVVAVDIANQRETWSFTPEESAGAFLSAPEPNDGKVYFGDYGASQGTFTPGVIASIFALDDSATPLWRAEEVAADRIVGSVLAADGKIFAGTADNSVVALNEQTGDVLWTFDDVGHSVWGQPALADGTLIVTSLDKGVYALNADSGSLIWNVELGGAIAAGALIHNNVAYISSFDDKLHALALSDGRELWIHEAEDWIWGAPVVEGNRLFVGDTKGNVFALEESTGNIIWQAAVDGAIEGGLAVKDGQVYIPVVQGVSTRDQTGAVVAVSADSGNVIWTQDTPLPIYVRPIFAADKLVVLGNQLESNGVGEFELLTFDPSSGAQGWSYQPAE